ncbi:MAG TPA: ferredoxin reductase family protein [Candidatus Dormibacteraeota bacterium]|nr:ferredoxin reductase family protein [Candidatus Dormibacteraeota bacterium]
MSSITARQDTPDRRGNRTGQSARPRRLVFTAGDVIVLIVINAVLVVAMWVRHGALNQLGSPSAKLTAAGQITALIGTYGALVQVLLMSRSPWLERRFGMDGLAQWHRWLGFSVTILIGAHVVFSTAGYALGDGKSFVAEAWTLITTYPYVLMATAATALLIMVAVTSLRMARRRLTWERWRFLHLYAYLAIALAFGHELAVGNDFTDDAIARWYWIGLYVAVLICLLAFRIGHPWRMSLRHQLRVTQVVPEAPGVVSLYVTGRDLDQLQARAGQYFRWRFLTRDGWWRTHPFSLSAPLNNRFLRLTIKGVGDDSRGLQGLHPGTRLAVEGPYGLFTAQKQRRSKVLLIAGGIGITPLRALIEEIPAKKDAITLIYRARSWEDVVFRDELEKLIRDRRGTIHYLIGQRGTPAMPHDPLSAQTVRRLVPDVDSRDVFVCGPASMMERMQEILTAIGVPPQQIHFERFALL